MTYLNRADAWNNVTPDVVKAYALPKKFKLTKYYAGLGTVEACTLLQYSARLKKDGYKIAGKELVGVNATARLDNPGSWKACAKFGMEVVDVDLIPTLNQNYVTNYVSPSFKHTCQHADDHLRDAKQFAINASMYQDNVIV